MSFSVCLYVGVNGCKIHNEDSFESAVSVESVNFLYICNLYNLNKLNMLAISMYLYHTNIYKYYSQYLKCVKNT